jgi:hypothetical protein
MLMETKMAKRIIPLVCILALGLTADGFSQEKDLKQSSPKG